MHEKTHSYLLVSMTRDYADEFDVSGFLVVSESYFEEAKARLRQFGDEEICLAFGTNEELFWDNAEELIQSLVVTRLSPVEVACFARHFPLDIERYPREFENWGQHLIAGFGEYCFLDGIELNPYDE